MAKCKDCLHMELCARDERLPDFTPEQEALCQFFVDRHRYVVREKGVTNADRIRAMSDEELAAFLWNIELGFTNGGWCDCRCEEDGGHSCTKCLAEWLKQPVKEG